MKINLNNIENVNKPFKHFIIDNFLDINLAYKISQEFPNYDDPNWIIYNNPLENKKALNNWNRFEPQTYNLISFLNSSHFIYLLKKITGIKALYPDIGLHGGGLHIHSNGGNLNIHLDYSVHPKLYLQRKLNLILYLTPEWEYDWGGNLELWSHDENSNLPKKKESVIKNIFNRAVIFDTTQNSWHGFAQPINCPLDVYRKSLAVYYLTDLDENAVFNRKRALYSPSEHQKNDLNILKLIKARNEF